jgi:HEAT repeat protein
MKPMLLPLCMTLAAAGCARRGDDYSVAGLMTKLQSSDAAARYEAANALKGFGPEAKPAVGLLSQAVKDTDRSLRIEAIYALAAIGQDAESTLPQIIETLKSPDGDVRLAGAYAVPLVGLRSSAAAPALKALVNDRDPRIRAEAASGLRKLQVASRFKNAAPTVSVTANN